MASTKQIYHETINGTVSLNVNGADAGCVGQIFTTDGALTNVDKIYVYLSVGSPLVLSLSIHENSGGSPGTSVGTGSAVFPSTGWVTITLDSAIDLTASTDYWLVIIGGPDDVFELGTDTSDSYGKTTETSITNTPFVGTTYSGDLAFQVWGEPAGLNPINPTDAETDVSPYGVLLQWENGADTGVEAYRLSYRRYGESYEEQYTFYPGESLEWLIEASQMYLGWTHLWKVEVLDISNEVIDEAEWTFTTQGLTKYPQASDTAADGGTIADANMIRTVRRLVVAADNKLWFEE